MRNALIVVLLIAAAGLGIWLVSGKKKAEPRAVAPAVEQPVDIPAADPAAALFAQAQGLKPVNVAEAMAKFERIAAEYADSEYAPRAFAEIAALYRGQNMTAEEKTVLLRILEQFPDTPAGSDARRRLGEINIAAIFSPAEGPHTEVYAVKSGDTLYKIAKMFNTTVELIARSNKITNALIKPGQKLKFVKGQFRIVVDQKARTLTLFDGQGFVKEYAVGLGADNSTPVGKFKINSRIAKPVWYKTGAIVPAGSPENILGTHWLGLSEPGYGIHGTTDSAPIQTQQTQGCVRMYNQEVEELYTIVPIGTEVEIVG
ncbi:MAG: L,D-transpeptidase family protein [Candidatus Omnitrophica bacterium]|nr:L,D-transpeptidase family protein [Candidatus Omnitrophota bacterium]